MSSFNPKRTHTVLDATICFAPFRYLSCIIDCTIPIGRVVKSHCMHAPHLVTLRPHRLFPSSTEAPTLKGHHSFLDDDIYITVAQISPCASTLTRPLFRISRYITAITSRRNESYEFQRWGSGLLRAKRIGRRPVSDKLR